MIYLHRRTGIAYALDPEGLGRLQERLREALGPRFNPAAWEAIQTPLGGVLRIRALDRQHLDVSTVDDPEMLAG